jgi:hypothetical protein
MKIGVVFIATGGPKVMRAVRSLRHMEPDIPIHVLMDMTTNTYFRNQSNPSLDDLRTLPNVKVLGLRENSAMVNGAFNAGVAWMEELGFDRACCLHDDLIFPSLLETQGYLSNWFHLLETEADFREASGIAFGHFEALVFWPGNIKHQSGNWHRAPAEWDTMDLESEEVWKRLCVDGVPEHEVDFPSMNFFTLYEGLRGYDRCRYLTRLGPTGFIIPIHTWRAIGGFDEQFGIFYDIVYPSECAVRGLNPIIVAPNSPFLHLHNQTTAFGDPVRGVWGDTLGAFKVKYGMDIDAFWKTHPNWLYEGERNWHK